MKSRNSAQQELSTSANVPYPSEPRHSGQAWKSYHSDRHATHDWGPSLTKQSEAESCDINKIIERFGKTGELPEGGPGVFGDFSQSSDFLEAQNIIAYAQQQFMSLDARVRARFQNNPAEFLAFMEDPENNGDEMVKLGLASRKDVEGGQPAPDKGPQGRSSAASKAPKVATPSGGAKAAKTAGEAVEEED